MLCRRQAGSRQQRRCVALCCVQQLERHIVRYRPFKAASVAHSGAQRLNERGWGCDSNVQMYTSDATTHPPLRLQIKILKSRTRDKQRGNKTACRKLDQNPQNPALSHIRLTAKLLYEYAAVMEVTYYVLLTPSAISTGPAVIVHLVYRI